MFVIVSSKLLANITTEICGRHDAYPSLPRTWFWSKMVIVAYLTWTVQ